MKIKLQEALDLVKAADVVKLKNNDRGFEYPIILFDSINNDPTNEVLYARWEDHRDEYRVTVREGENAEVERDGHRLTFIDDEGEPVELHLFREIPILP